MDSVSVLVVPLVSDNVTLKVSVSCFTMDFSVTSVSLDAMLSANERAVLRVSVAAPDTLSVNTFAVDFTSFAAVLNASENVPPLLLVVDSVSDAEADSVSVLAALTMREKRSEKPMLSANVLPLLLALAKTAEMLAFSDSFRPVLFMMLAVWDAVSTNERVIERTSELVSVTVSENTCAPAVTECVMVSEKVTPPLDVV